MVNTAFYVGGDLRTGNALLKSKQQLFALSGRQDAPRALVLFSSGSSSDDASLPAAELRDSGVKVTRGNSQVTRGQLAGKGWERGDACLIGRVFAELDLGGFRCPLPGQ